MEVLRRKGQEVIRNMGMVTRTAANVLCELNNNFVIVRLRHLFPFLGKDFICGFSHTQDSQALASREGKMKRSFKQTPTRDEIIKTVQSTRRTTKVHLQMIKFTCTVQSYAQHEKKQPCAVKCTKSVYPQKEIMRYSWALSM